MIRRSIGRASMNSTRILSFAAVAAAAALAGCASQSAEPEQPSVRQTSLTAPTDLQLLCANEAAQTYGVPSDSVLPVSSSAQGTTYTVVLNAGGSQAVCTIDDEGTVLSLERA
jgi:hypothetical protein